jgi:endonuclease/exonuclease/phosphatase family metal-dependent hydrolase
LALGLGLLASRDRCAPKARIATFNIRMFPEPTTDFERVSATLAELDADLLGVQEIIDQGALMAVLQQASIRTGRTYRAVISRCRSAKHGITTGLVWDASKWRLIEEREYPDLLPDLGVPCGEAQPGLLGIFADRQGRRIALLSVHLDAFPDKFEVRREQWRRLIAIQKAVHERHRATVVALGDFNSTGFDGQPSEERQFVLDVVQEAGFRLLTAEVPCTEYYLPEGRREYVPSVLDHLVVTDGRWSAPKAIGFCERLACRITAAEDMDEDFVRVSDHCPVVVEGSPGG